MQLELIEGIGSTYANSLREAGIKSVAKLLEAGASKKGREVIAKATSISDALILRWVNHADLCRIKGVSSQYSELLEASGVDTVKELRTRRADNLAVKMREVNDNKKLVRRPPSEAEVSRWIEQAKTLPPMLTY